jgi:hypothetical protein
VVRFIAVHDFGYACVEAGVFHNLSLLWVEYFPYVAPSSHARTHVQGSAYILLSLWLVTGQPGKHTSPFSCLLQLPLSWILRICYERPYEPFSATNFLHSTAIACHFVIAHLKLGNNKSRIWVSQNWHTLYPQLSVNGKKDLHSTLSSKGARRELSDPTKLLYTSVIVLCYSYLMNLSHVVRSRSFSVVNHRPPAWEWFQMIKKCIK